jgi:hypothetical protein
VSEALDIVAAAAAGGVALRALGRLREPHVTLSPDGRRYLAMAAGRPAAFPFALRWLLPALCSTSVRRWRGCTAVHLGALPPLLAVWLTGRVDDPAACVAGGLLVCGLPGVWRIHLRWPVLVDPAAMAWALASAVCAQHRLWLPAVAAAVVAGCIKETAPAFAACYAWHPVALVGLLAPLVRAATTRPGEDIEGEMDILEHPIRASRITHAGRWLDPSLMLTPWGVCLLAPAAGVPLAGPILAVTLTLAYGQVFVAVDTVRLYQWAFPPAIAATLDVVPARLAFAALALHLLNPWAGDGL